MKRLFFALTAWLVVALPAQAQDFEPYVGFGLGAFGVELKESPAFNQKNTVFGGYGKLGVDINDYVAAELRIGATGTGTTTYPPATFGKGIPVDIKLQSTYFLSYLAKLKLPVNPDLRFYGLLGGTTAKFKTTAAVLGAAASISKTKTGFSYGAGVEWRLDDQLTLGAEWAQYWTDVNLTNVDQARIWGAVGSLTTSF